MYFRNYCPKVFVKEQCFFMYSTHNREFKDYFNSLFTSFVRSRKAIYIFYLVFNILYRNA